MVAPSPYKGSRPLSALVDTITKPIFSKRGALEARLITDWVQIAGSKLAVCVVPKYIAFPSAESKKDGILHLEVSNSSIAAELAYTGPVLLEKIAVYLGYKAIAKLRIHLHPVPFLKRQGEDEWVVPRLTAGQEGWLDGTLAEVDDPALKEVLYNFGKLLAAKKKS